jgi:NADH:ubiquinone oxidoreductase subunit E
MMVFEDRRLVQGKKVVADSLSPGLQHHSGYLPADVWNTTRRNCWSPPGGDLRCVTCYAIFTLNQGQAHRSCCRGTACHVREVGQHVEVKIVLTEEENGATEDLRFTRSPWPVWSVRPCSGAHCERRDPVV